MPLAGVPGLRLTSALGPPPFPALCSPLSASLTSLLSGCFFNSSLKSENPGFQGYFLLQGTSVPSPWASVCSSAKLAVTGTLKGYLGNFMRLGVLHGQRTSTGTQQMVFLQVLHLTRWSSRFMN